MIIKQSYAWIKQLCKTVTKTVALLTAMYLYNYIICVKPLFLRMSNIETLF
jgi:hypothetical protein